MDKVDLALGQILPKEIIAIVKYKVEMETEDSRLQIFEDFIVPWVYKLRDEGGWHDWAVYECGNLFSKEITGRFKPTTFILTSLKRVCKRLKKDVSLGAVSLAEVGTVNQYYYNPNGYYFNGGFYFDNKHNPFQ